MEFRILGPVEVVADGRSVPVGGTRQRALLAALLLHADDVVSTGRLIEALWGEDAPATAGKTLQVHVSRLRRDLGDEVSLVARPPGYVLQLEGSEFDLRRFDSLAEQGRAALDAGDSERAGRVLREALAQWRGPALADLVDEPVAATAASRLEDQRLAVLEDRIDADLASGRAQDVVAEAARLVEEHPLRERVRAQLMLALYRSGRQADALTAFQDARRVLAEELGLEPGPRLRDLERRILEQDPTLLGGEAIGAPQTSAAPVLRSRTARSVAAVAALAVAVAAVVIATTWGGDPPERQAVAGVEPFRATGNTMVQINADTGVPTLVADVGKDPDRLVVTRNVAWVANFGDRTLSRVDLATGNIETVKGLPGVASVATTPLGGVFVSSFARFVWFVPEATMRPEKVVSLRGHAEALAFGAGSLWITSPSVERGVGGDRVIQLGERDEIVARIPVGATPIYATFGYGHLWTANYDGDTISVIRPGAKKADTVPVGDGPLGIAAGEGAIWVVQFGDQEVWRVDPVTHEITARIPVGPGPLDVAAGGGWVWVTCRESGTVVQIDPRTNMVHRTVDVGLAPHGVAVSEDGALVTVRSAPYGP